MNPLTRLRNILQFDAAGVYSVGRANDRGFSVGGMCLTRTAIGVFADDC